MKSNDQILLENAYARTYGIRKVRDSEVEQMIEDINAATAFATAFAKIDSRVEEMHHGHLKLLKQHLEPLQKSLEPLQKSLEQTLQQINSRLNPSAS